MNPLKTMSLTGLAVSYFHGMCILQSWKLEFYQAKKMLIYLFVIIR